MTALPASKSDLRPSLSTQVIAPNVASKFTVPSARVCRREEDVSRPVVAKIVGA